MALMFTKPRRIRGDDDLSGFCCGEQSLDLWLEKHAIQALSQGTAVTYVTFSETGELAGYYSLSAHSVARGNVRGGWLPRNTPEQIPVILLGRLAVSEQFKGDGLGARLLKDAVERALAAAYRIGARALIVDPLGDQAANFYEHFGFRHLQGSTRMFAKLA